MKNVSNEIKQLLRDGIPVYTFASIKAKHKTSGIETPFLIFPGDFSLRNNNYEINGGVSFPIGNVISKSIKLTILNKWNTFDDYDLNTASVSLSSWIYPDGVPANPNTGYVSMYEGTFYATDIKTTAHEITITAYDSAAVLDGKYAIRTADPVTGQPMYATLWDYFVYLCDHVYPQRRGLPEAEGSEHYYSDHLETDKFLNSDMSLPAIQPESRPQTTLRDVFGYIAQLACGNVVIDNYGKIDIVSYNLPDYEIFNGMKYKDQVSTVYDGGTFGDGDHAINRLIGGSFSDTDYIMLNKAISPPTLEYNDVQYTQITMKYPIENSNEDGTIVYPNNADYNYNTLELYNPLCQDFSPSKTEDINVLKNIYLRIGSKNIKPFNGSFMNNPIVEFMDNVIVLDIDGSAYFSFVGHHTMNYLGTSEIANNTPTVGRNRRTLY